MTVNLLSLFSGIGAFEKALSNLNVPTKTVAWCEIDKHAAAAYAAVHSESLDGNLGDVTSVDAHDPRLQEVNLLTYGFPCQDLSSAGGRAGFFDERGGLTRSGLVFEALRLIEGTRPAIAIAENVPALLWSQHEEGFALMRHRLSDLGYTTYWTRLRADSFGLPQKRERVFIVSIRSDIDDGVRWPLPRLLDVTLGDFLQDSPPDSVYLTVKKYEADLAYRRRHVLAYRSAAQGNGFGIKPVTPADVAPTLTTSNDRPDTPRILELLQADSKDEAALFRLRKPTSLEAWRLQGFTDSDWQAAKDTGSSETALYRMAGNSIAVNVVEALLDSLLADYADVFDIKHETSAPRTDREVKGAVLI